jgi:hypothetical protein
MLSSELAGRYIPIQYVEAVCFSEGRGILRRLVAGLSPRRPGFASGPYTWDLWWTNWHWDRVSLISSVFSCHYHSTVTLHTHVSSGGWTIGPLVAAVQRRNLSSSLWTWYERVPPKRWHLITSPQGCTIRRAPSTYWPPREPHICCRPILTESCILVQ